MSKNVQEDDKLTLESSKTPDEYGPMVPGSATYEEIDDVKTVNIKGTVAQAHYAGMDEKEAEETWKVESLCFSCLSAGVCRHANGIQDSLVVVARCLAYIPSTS